MWVCHHAIIRIKRADFYLSGSPWLCSILHIISAVTKMQHQRESSQPLVHQCPSSAMAPNNGSGTFEGSAEWQWPSFSRTCKGLRRAKSILEISWGNGGGAYE